MMAGTLMLLRQAGCELHYMNIANGSCGTAAHSKQKIINIRSREARSAARLLGAVFHPSFVDDIAIFYEKDLLARVAAVVRKVNPTIMLLPPPVDYMEDHMNACRLAVTAAFCRGMRNFTTKPRTKPIESAVTLYHCMPAGLRDPMRRRVVPEYYVDITGVLQQKRTILACHRSQKEWLDVSQGMDAYLAAMEEQAAEMGRMSRRFKYAEGWRRHSHLGFCEPGADAMLEALGELALVNEDYRRSLDEPSHPKRTLRAGRKT
ncbi:MAG: PIG-L family deacetylase [Armatimonadota bacterium]|nr:MAG: PIG-L family deacetylase [Armatimonadota bacterium]